MEALFFTFAKRKNSLKVPVESTGTSFNVVIKEPTSFDAPTLIITADTFQYNYAKFNDQYFFITQTISRRNNLWEVRCEKDVLATYRTQILETSAFVMYSASAYNDEISDARIPVKTSNVVRQNSIAFPLVDSIGRYVISVTGKSSTNSWVIPYRMNPSSIVNSVYNHINEEIFDDERPVSTGLDGIKDWIKYLADMFIHTSKNTLSSGNAIECIRSCYWMPFNFSGDTDPEIIWLGQYNTGYAASKIINPIATGETVYVNIPWVFNDWRRNKPYTELYIYVPFIGVIPISPSNVIGLEAVGINYSLNKLNGNLSIMVTAGNEVLGTYGTETAISVPIGGSNVTPRQLFNTVAGGIGLAGAVMTGNAALGTSAMAGITSGALAALQGIPASVGGLAGGAASGLSTNIICFTVTHDTVNAPAAQNGTIGRPLFAERVISSLSGYCECNNFSLQAAAKSGDLDAVNNYMNSGVFIE